ACTSTKPSANWASPSDPGAVAVLARTAAASAAARIAFTVSASIVSWAANGRAEKARRRESKTSTGPAPRRAAAGDLPVRRAPAGGRPSAIGHPLSGEKGARPRVRRDRADGRADGRWKRVLVLGQGLGHQKGVAGRKIRPANQDVAPERCHDPQRRVGN